MSRVEIDNAKTRLSELIDDALTGQEVIITKDSKPLVKLVPVSKKIVRPKFGSAKGLFTISENFDDPIEGFEEYMR